MASNESGSEANHHAPQGLFRILSPIPPTHTALAPAFLADNEASLQRLGPAIWLAVGCFWLVFIIVDATLYRAVFWPLALLRIVLVVNALAVAFVSYRRLHAVSPFNLYGVSVLITWATICLMLIVNRDSTGQYAMPLTGGILFIALLPWTVPWMLTLSLAPWLFYTLALLFIPDALVSLRVWVFNISILTTALLGLAAYTQLQRLRWANFFNEQQVLSLNRRMQGELNLARGIQQSLLAAPQARWLQFELACYSEPAREVGGDFYLYHGFSDGRLALAVGDISGKGLPAALLMSTSLASLQASLGDETSPATRLARLDYVLTPYTKASRQNCALCYAELQGKSMRLANAGGIAPLIRRRAGCTEWIEIGGLPLGVGLGAQLGYQDRSVALESGDLVVFCSDGLVETMNERGELFGFDRVEQATRDCAARTPRDLVDGLLGAATFFRGAAEQHDDLTIVVIGVQE
jgi:serine phosphatase RsbU (regulator of sigma subunit)